MKTGLEKMLERRGGMTECKYCESCYKCPLCWDCEVAIEDQCDYENDDGIYDLPCWDNGLFYKD